MHHAVFSAVQVSRGLLPGASLLPCPLCPLAPTGRLFNQLVDMLRFYLAFPIEPLTGAPLSDDDIIARHYSRVQQLQRLLFKHHPELKDLALANCGAVAKRSRLAEALQGLDEGILRQLVIKQLRCALVLGGQWGAECICVCVSACFCVCACIRACM